MNTPTNHAPETRNVLLNAQEANVLLEFINIAVKARGLEAAEAGLILSRRVQAAFAAPAAPTSDSLDRA